MVAMENFGDLGVYRPLIVPTMMPIKIPKTARGTRNQKQHLRRRVSGSFPGWTGNEKVKDVNGGSPFRPSPPAGEPTRPSMEERRSKTAKCGSSYICSGQLGEDIGRSSWW
nr:hypothetical protein Itr_chr02CG08720 [Ipomoea trifida]